METQANLGVSLLDLFAKTKNDHTLTEAIELLEAAVAKLSAHTSTSYHDHQYKQAEDKDKDELYVECVLQMHPFISSNLNILAYSVCLSNQLGNCLVRVLVILIGKL